MFDKNECILYHFSPNIYSKAGHKYERHQSYGLKINKKTFISTAAVLICVMIAAFILTQVAPMGTFERTLKLLAMCFGFLFVGHLVGYGPF